MPDTTVQKMPAGGVMPKSEARHYGWLPELPDHRDRRFDATKKRRSLPRGARPKITVPRKVDLRTTGVLSPIKDQGQLGSCTANAIAAVAEYEMRREGQTAFDISRLFIYFNERVAIDTTAWDSGAFIRDGFKSLDHLGAPPEGDWPYDIGRFRDRPPAKAYQDGQDHQALAYGFIETNGSQTHLKQALAAQTPVVFGFSVTPEYEDVGPDGVMKTPKADSPVLGGHAIYAAGYETLGWQYHNRVYLITPGSWAESFGDHGVVYMPATWACDLSNADDFWAIQDMEG